MPMEPYHKAQQKQWLTCTYTKLLETAWSSVCCTWSDGLLHSEEVMCAGTSGLLHTGLAGRKRTLDSNAILPALSA